MRETTHKELGAYAGFPEETTCEPVPCPPAFLEYSWYVLLTYAMLGRVWGVVIPSVGGALLALLAAACFLSVGARVYAPVALALCTGVSVIAVQFFFYSAVSLNESIVVFGGWLFTVIIVQALAQRPRFLHRFGLVAFVIGLCVLPYTKSQTGAEIVRIAASGTGISNPNSLAMWFGFCALFFLFWGMQARTHTLRAVHWAAALGSLYVVALTVSRGALVGIILACVVGFRSELKRGFYPVLSFVLLMWVIYESGVFQQAIDSYIMRGTEETGREKLWSLALERLLNSPWTGVGLEEIRIQTHLGGTAHTPHNPLLHIGLAAGIIPLICFLGYLARVVSGALLIMWRVSGREATLLPALVTFGLFEIMLTSVAFMSAWVVVVFALGRLHVRPNSQDPTRRQRASDLSSPGSSTQR